MSEPGCHFVLQRVLECDYTNGAPRDAKYGNDSDTIGRGIIIHCAFLKGATSAHLKRAVDFIFDCSNFGVDNKNSIRKSEGAYGIMIIPQASLAGKKKGRKMQYHKLMPRNQEGEEFYLQFVSLVRSAAEAASKAALTKEEGDRKEKGSKSIKVVAGGYGMMQALKIVTPGPYTHQFQI